MGWLLHGGFIFSIIKNPNYLVLILINLSANIDVSMHFQGHIEERHSSVPEI